MDDTDTLEHYGIKGMRWGFRRNSKGGYSRSGNRVKEVSEDAARAKAVSLKKKSAGIDSLSNTDIQDLVTRLNLEQQLSTLSAKQNPGKMKKAEEFIDRLDSRVKRADKIYNMANSPSAKRIRSEIVKQMNK